MMAFIRKHYGQNVYVMGLVSSVYSYTNVGVVDFSFIPLVGGDDIKGDVDISSDILSVKGSSIYKGAEISPSLEAVQQLGPFNHGPVVLFRTGNPTEWAWENLHGGEEAQEYFGSAHLRINKAKLKEILRDKYIGVLGGNGVVEKEGANNAIAPNDSNAAERSDLDAKESSELNEDIQLIDISLLTGETWIIDAEQSGFVQISDPDIVKAFLSEDSSSDNENKSHSALQSEDIMVQWPLHGVTDEKMEKVCGQMVLLSSFKGQVYISLSSSEEEKEVKGNNRRQNFISNLCRSVFLYGETATFQKIMMLTNSDDVDKLGKQSSGSKTPKDLLQNLLQNIRIHLAATFEQWDEDKFTQKVQILSNMVHPPHGEEDKNESPTLVNGEINTPKNRSRRTRFVFFHCLCGCDRTGSLAVSYDMYRKWAANGKSSRDDHAHPQPSSHEALAHPSFHSLLKQNYEFIHRPMLRNYQLKAQWYCEHLRFLGLYPMDDCFPNDLPLRLHSSVSGHHGESIGKSNGHSDKSALEHTKDTQKYPFSTKSKAVASSKSKSLKIDRAQKRPGLRNNTNLEKVSKVSPVKEGTVPAAQEDSLDRFLDEICAGVGGDDTKSQGAGQTAPGADADNVGNSDNGKSNGILHTLCETFDFRTDKNHLGDEWGTKITTPSPNHNPYSGTYYAPAVSEQLIWTDPVVAEARGTLERCWDWTILFLIALVGFCWAIARFQSEYRGEPFKRTGNLRKRTLNNKIVHSEDGNSLNQALLN